MNLCFIRLCKPILYHIYGKLERRKNETGCMSLIVLGASLLLRYWPPKDGAMEDNTPHQKHPIAHHMYHSKTCNKGIYSKGSITVGREKE
jgi:hypothetical protein